jgi:hypothetical protein
MKYKETGYLKTVDALELVPGLENIAAVKCITETTHKSEYVLWIKLWLPLLF